jgi:hypothetical protein
MTIQSDWYTQTIEATLDKHPDASADARLVARAVMVAGMFAAEATDAASESNIESLDTIALNVERLAEKCDSISLAVGNAGAQVATALYDLPAPTVEQRSAC